MAKYSTGSSSGSKDDSCQLCGETDKPLTTAKMEGATVTVCRDCEPDDSHREDNTSGGSDSSGSKQSSDAHERQVGSTPGYSISRTDSDWAEETDYGNTSTPYLKDNYSKRFTDALDDAGITKQELADETGLPLASLKSLEQGTAISDDVGEKIIEGVEEALDIELKEKV